MGRRSGQALAACSRCFSRQSARCQWRASWTAEVRGDRPWSAWKIAVAVVLVLVLIAAGVYLNEMSGQGGF